MSSDEELTRLAAAALLREALLGATRASIAGPSGWKKQNRCVPNKAFLKNTLKGVLSSNRVRDKKIVSRSEEKRRDHETHLKEQNKYKKRYISASTKNSKKNGVIDVGPGSSVPTDNNVEERLTSTTRPSKAKQNVPKKFAQSLVWTDGDCLELQPVTKKSTKKDRREQSLQRARKMIRSLSFVQGANLGYSSNNET